MVALGTCNKPFKPRLSRVDEYELVKVCRRYIHKICEEEEKKVKKNKKSF